MTRLWDLRPGKQDLVPAEVKQDLSLLRPFEIWDRP